MRAQVGSLRDIGTASQSQGWEMRVKVPGFGGVQVDLTRAHHGLREIEHSLPCFSAVFQLEGCVQGVSLCLPSQLRPDHQNVGDVRPCGDFAG